MVKPPTKHDQAASLDEKRPTSAPTEAPDSNLNHGNAQTDPEKLAAAPTSFDVDLESGNRLGVPRPTLHENASSPAVIGGSHPTDEETPITNLADSGTTVQDGAPRRRNKPQGETLQLPGGPPRRAQSLPTHSPVNTPGQVQVLTPNMVQALNKLLEPEHKLAPPPTVRVSLWNIATYSWINVMLLFVPVAWGMHFAHQSDTVIFVFSFLAIVPLAALLGFATEELAIRVGQTLGGLLNATFGNAVELIIAILALTKGELRIVQASMLGSILSNCLLVLGMCFFAGGFRFHEQGYGIRAAQLNISLLSISVFSIVIPAAFSSSLHLNQTSGSTGQDQAKTDQAVLAISRGTSIILLFVYAAYLVFQLWTHAYIYSKEASAWHSAQTHQVSGVDGPTAPPGTRVFRVPNLPSLPSLPTITIHGRSDSSSTSSSSTRSRRSSTSSSSSSSSGEEEEHQKLKPVVALILLVIVTVLTGLTAEFLVDSISGLTATGNISREFIALILLPLVGNAAEHVTAVTVSVKNKLDLAITVAVGSSIQIALFVIPFLVLLGWIIGQPLSLFFDIYETVVVFVSILVVNYAISDGKTNWLEGLVLMIIYVLIALTTWYYPGTDLQ